jgi:HEAT repeat protein
MKLFASPSREDLIAIDQYLRPLAAPVIALSKKEKHSTYWANWLAESRLYEPLFYLTMEGKCPDDFSACEKRLFRLLRRALDADWAVPLDDFFIRWVAPESYYRDIDPASTRELELGIGDYLGKHGLDPVWWENEMDDVQKFKSHLVRKLLQIRSPSRGDTGPGSEVRKKLYEAILEHGDEVAKMQLAAHFLLEGRAPFYWKERLFQSAEELGLRHTLAYALDPKDKEERKLLEALSRDPDDDVRVKVADKIQLPHMLEDPNPEVRTSAIWGLPLTREQASRLVEDPSPTVRQALLEKALLSGGAELTVEELLYLYDSLTEKKASLNKLLRKRIKERMGRKGEVALTFMDLDF